MPGRDSAYSGDSSPCPSFEVYLRSDLSLSDDSACFVIDDLHLIPGYCYLEDIPERFLLEAVEFLGRYPTLAKVRRYASILEDYYEEDEEANEDCAFIGAQLCLSFQRWHRDGPEVLVGSAADIVQESMRVNATEIGKLAALDQFNDDLKSVPKTRFRVSGSEMRKLQRYMGFQIMAQNKVRPTNDHLWLEVARDFLREDLDSRFPHNLDFSRALHVGATTTDWKRWSSHLGHDFLFFLGESKDLARIYEDFVKLLGTKLQGMSIPSLTSVKANTTILRTDHLRDTARLLEKGGRKRIWFAEETLPKGVHDVLFFSDSLYSMSENDFAKYWHATGAKVAYATMFFPDKLNGEFAPQSEIYRYEEYYERVEDVVAFVDKIWPSILLATPVLPLKGIAEGFHHLLIWCLSRGWKQFGKWMHDLATDDFPVEMAFGVAFDVTKLVPIYRHLLRMIRPVLRHHLARVRVVWKGGYSNGYDHKLSTWDTWRRKRRFDIGDGGIVDCEIQAQRGEMYLLKFWRSTGSSSLAYSLELPLERTAVLVADLESAFDPGTYKHFGLSKMPYFPVVAKDWYTLLNWALAEPIDSLSFGVLMTTLNRIRGGLSLSSNVLVEPMAIEDAQVAKIALACYMEVCRRHGIVSQIEGDKDLKAAYESNAKELARQVGKVALTVLTGGLAIPIAFIFKWLVTTHPTVEFVRYPKEPETQLVKARSKPASLPITGSSIVLPHKELVAKASCMLCQLQREGAFSGTGDERDGQWMICENRGVDAVHDISFQPADITDMIRVARDSEVTHTGFGATKLVPNITKFKHWLEAMEGGIDAHVEIHHIEGGPGTGKTEVLKVLMDRLEKQGYGVGVITPFGELQTDYTNTTVLGDKSGQRKTFDAQTTWYATSWTAKDVIFVDECTAVDWQFIKAICAYTGVKRLYLVGDKKQTVLNTANNEGTDPTNPSSGLDWSRIPTHCLVKNYRLDAWRVKWHNQKYGYKMLAVRNDSLPPKLISRATYQQMKEDGHGAEREIVFAHASGLEIFGRDSKAGDREVPNLSVRSCQGKTFKGATAISASQLDYANVEVHGMLNVANSRGTGQVYYVYYDSVADPTPRKLAQELSVDSQDAIDKVAALPWPDVEKPPERFSLSEEEQRMENEMKERKRFGKVEVAKDPDEPDEFVSGCDTKQTIKVGNGGLYEDMDSLKFATLEMFRTVFNTCLVDALLDYDSSERVLDFVLDFMVKVYDDDRLMARPHSVGNFAVWNVHWGNEFRPLPCVDGKVMLPQKPFIREVERVLFPVFLFVQGKPRYATKGYQLPNRSFVLNISGMHAENFQMPTYPAIVPGMNEGMPVEMDGRTTISGKYLFEYYQTDVVARKTKKEGIPILTHLEGEVAGYAPTYHRVTLPPMSRQHLNFAQEHEPITSSWARVESEPEERLHRGQKLRLGTDAYRLASFIDPSGAHTRTSMLNEAGVVQGPLVKTNATINWDGFIHQRTGTGRIRKPQERQYRSIAPGVGNWYNNTPVESLLAAQRIGRRQPKPSLTSESKAFAIQLARDAYYEYWRPNYLADREMVNAKVEEAIKAARSRNYDGRMDSENKKRFTPLLTCSNKDQFKPIKNGKLNLGKPGQVLLQSPAKTNLEFIGWMRAQGLLFKKAMKADCFTDDYETASGFRKRITKAIRELPEGVRTAIVDGEEWDSQQNAVTVEIEKELCRLFGASSRTIEDYFAIRGNLPFIMFGVFRGTTNGEKGSGFLDTKLGNTKLQAVVANAVIKGTGPKVVGVKGDDYLRMQSGLHVDTHNQQKIKTLLGMKLNIDIGEGGEFCGNSVSRAGMYPSVTRAAMKTVASKAETYEKFAEQQQALRDKIEEYQDCGLEETIHYSAVAEKTSANYVKACLEFINSMAHIGKAQWLAITKLRSNPRFHLPSAFGPTIV